MDTITEAPTDAKGVMGFFKYVFDFDETNKSLIFNMIQYALLALIPTQLSLKGIKYVMPEDDESKGSLEILAEVLAQIVMLVLTIWFVNKMVRYVPTYSGVDYHGFNETNFLIPMLVIVLSMESRLGEKIRILMDRVLDLWDGSSKKEEEKKEQQKKAAQQAQAQGQAGPGPQAPVSSRPPMVNESTLGMGGIQGGVSQSQAAQAAAMTPSYQNPDFNQFYQNDMVPLMDANEPMAANEMGSAFGSAW